MKKTFFALVLCACLAGFAGAEGIAEDSRKGVEKADLSYAIGMLVASDIRGMGDIELNYGEFSRAFRTYTESEETRLTEDEAMQILQAYFDKTRAEENAKNIALGKAFLEENRKRPGVVVTPSGLQFELLLEGDGETPAESDTVLVHYRGTTVDGEVFDSTPDDEPMKLSLDHVIPGWAEGLRIMKEGSRATLVIPPDLGYGEQGIPGAITPNSVLVFEVELLEIVRPEK